MFLILKSAKQIYTPPNIANTKQKQNIHFFLADID